MVLTDKKEMYAVYDRGGFGNRLRTWPTLDAYYESTFAEPVVLRYKGKHGGSWCEYGVVRDNVADTVARWVSEGADPSLIVVNELADDASLILQGEFMQSMHYLSGRYSTLPLPMRKALAQSQHHVEGVRAVVLLRDAMSPASWSDFNELMELYPDAVIELSVWNHDVGDCPRRNTVFWEVRHY